MRIILFGFLFSCSGLLFAQLVVTPSLGSGFYDIDPPGVSVSIDPPILASVQAGYQSGWVEPTLGVSFQRLRASLAAGEVAEPLRNNDLYLWGGVAVHLPDADADRESCALVIGAGYLFDVADFGSGVAAIRGGVDLRIADISLGLFAQVSYPSGTDYQPWLTSVQLGIPLWLSPE